MKPAQPASSYPLHAFPALPSLEVPFSHSARLPLAKYQALSSLAWAFESELTPLAAYEMLVSAACYLALAPTGDAASTLEASQLLQKLSEQMMEAPQGEVSDLIWKRKQASWDRYRHVETAIRYCKAASEFRRAGKTKRPQGKLTAWWSSWRGMSQVQPF